MGERIRIRGVVQGVGFRPTVARVARRYGVGGYVRNDGEGVEIVLTGDHEKREAFFDALQAELPRLARVDAWERSEDPSLAPAESFRIEASESTPVTTEVAADAGMCAACAAEVLDPYERRYRYPFATCTLCGPRYTIATKIPFDRPHTTMSGFPLCSECRTEYEDESDRRYHAQAVACHRCGPTARLERTDGRAFSIERFSMMDAVDAVGSLLQLGEIVAVKGLGSYHLCCDATNPEAVRRLRERKRRPSKPFALMARDLDIVRQYANIDAQEQAAMQSPGAPIVLLDARLNLDVGTTPLAAEIAPGQRSLGFMLPYTPLHLLILRRVKRPIVCTSGNLSEEPPCIEDTDAKKRLGEIADWFLVHDRPIHNRVDDSVVRRVQGKVRMVRRARGYAPGTVSMPPGLTESVSMVAAGGQFKSAFALVDNGQAVLSPHLGNLDELSTFTAFLEAYERMSALYAHRPRAVVVDQHREYRSSMWGRELAEREGLPLIRVQHHHSHAASVMAENGYSNEGPPVLGIVLDGLGLGEKGAIWGGEFLLTEYARYRRIATFKPVAMLGGDLASRQPWRNLYAHLRAETGWQELECNFGDLPIIQRLKARKAPLVEQAIVNSSLSPLASSCGRLFDAVAAAVGIQFEQIEYEGQAAAELEASITPDDLEEALATERYPIGVPTHPSLDIPYLEFKGLWCAILGDLFAETRPGLISARFHVALAETLVRVAKLLRGRFPEIATVALGGGCFVNRILSELTHDGLVQEGFHVLLPTRLPAHDGGLALGQAATAAAQMKR